MNKLVYLIIGVVAVMFLCVAGIAVIGGTAVMACQPAGSPPASVEVSRWDAEQLGNAHIIVTVGIQRQIPARGHIVALATAIQESGLRNLPHLGGSDDHDSIGLFQQRPSQGWGTPAQLADPTYQTARFYDKLITVNGWEQMAVTQAAQAVQRSAYPDAYEKWSQDAAQLHFQLTGEPDSCLNTGTSGWMMPVNGPIVSGYHTAQRPDHHGIDISARKTTPIRAAATGNVIRVECNASLNGQPYSCDQDGSPAVKGCGWFAEVLSGNIIHRYCHMLTRPGIAVGDQVVSGQILGVVGTSGHSSGPHLHWEVHDVSAGGPATPENSLDPETFLRQVGALVP